MHRKLFYFSQEILSMMWRHQAGILNDLLCKFLIDGLERPNPFLARDKLIPLASHYQALSEWNLLNLFLPPYCSWSRLYQNSKSIHPPTLFHLLHYQIFFSLLTPPNAC